MTDTPGLEFTADKRDAVKAALELADEYFESPPDQRSLKATLFTDGDYQIRVTHNATARTASNRTEILWFDHLESREDEFRYIVLDEEGGVVAENRSVHRETV